MRFYRSAGILVLCLVLACCRVATEGLRPVAGSGQGSVVVYLQPLPGEAEQLRLLIGPIAAVDTAGVEHPLARRLDQIGLGDSDRERLLAGGPVPRGSYAGLSLHVPAAFLAGREGDRPLQVEPRAVRIDLPFSVTRRQAVVLSLRLHPGDSVGADYRFAPEFSATIPAPTASRLTGIATNCDAGTLTVFDKIAGRVSAVIPVGRSPGGVALDPVRLLAYVALTGEDAVEVIDLQQGRSVDRVQLFGGDQPVELVLTPDRRSLLVVNEGSDSLSVIDALTLSETARIQVGDEPASVLVDRTGRQAFVFNGLSGSVSVVDLPAAAVAATVSTEAEPVRGQLDRRGERLYVIHELSSYLTVIDTLSLEIVERLHVGSGATALKVDPRTDRLYLARRNALEVDIYDPFSLLPVDSIPVPGEVAYMTIDDEGNNLGLVLPELGEIRILRLVSKDTVARVEIGARPCWATFLGER